MMSEKEQQMQEALLRIAEVAHDAVNGQSDLEDLGHERYGDNGAERVSRGEMPSCTLRSLPRRLLIRAAETAVKINPVNAPVLNPASEVSADLVSDPLKIAVLTSKYWGPTERTLTVSFMESTPRDLRLRIISHLNAWTKTAGIQFAETQGTGIVRISRGPGGYWSYLGTDILHISQNRPTMNLQGFTMSTSEREFRRVVRHEAGHTLAFAHEHVREDIVARIDPQKAYEYFRRTQGWDRATVDQQVLTPLSESSIMGTPPDETSIMAYQLPSSITRDGRPIIGGLDINDTDYEFAGRIYPLQSREQVEPNEGSWCHDAEGFLEEAASL